MDFDQFSNDYNDQLEKALLFGPKEHDFYLDAKIRTIRARLGEMGRDPGNMRLLDLGCGTGVMTRKLADVFGEVVGADVSGKCVDEARRNNPDLSFTSYDGQTLPYPDSSFDGVVSVCVLHHVPQAQWHSFLVEAMRVLRPGGAFMLVEHNPLNPITRWIVSRCPFDDDAVLLTSGTAKNLFSKAGYGYVGSDYFLFTPFKIAAFQKIETGLLRGMPLGAQYLAVATKPGENE